MSQESISDRRPESYEDYAYRFQLAEGLPKDERGIIFIGNTRAGKSTLALAMSGEAMKVVYGQGALTYLNPVDEKFQDIVRNTQQSVTEKPNFYPARKGHNKLAIVDMPGHADSSRFRELINFHYIRTMAANLKEVRFLLVVTLQFRNGKFVLPEKELQMLNSFRVMFPNCQEYINIVINRLEDASNNSAAACACFRDSIVHCNNPDITRYYSHITNNKIHVIERPPYKKGSNGEERHEAPYNSIGRRMQEICNSEAQFMQLSNHTYYSLNIFRAGDQLKNNEFYEKLLEILTQINNGVEAASTLFTESVFIILRSIVNEPNRRPAQRELVKLYDQFLKNHSVETPYKRSLTPLAFEKEILLDKSKILQLLDVIGDEKITNPLEQQVEYSREELRRVERYCRLVSDSYSSKLLQVVELTFGKEELLPRVQDFYLYLIRKLEQSFFIANILLEAVGGDKVRLGQSFDVIYGMKRRFKDFSLIADEGFVANFETLAQDLINLNVPALFREFSNGQYDQLKKQLLDDYNIIDRRGYNAFRDKAKFQKEIIPRIPAKKDEVEFFVSINIEPNSPQEVSSHIEKLLKLYQPSDLSMRVAILGKVARLLERQKEYKHAIVLYILLSLNEQAMRVLSLAEPTLKKESLAQFYSEVASAFEENAMFFYAQRCLESCKAFSTDSLDQFIQYERRVLRLNDPAHTAPILKRRLEAKDKQSLWNWGRIQDEVLFLKQKYRIKDQSPTKSVMLKNYR